jgi:isoamylase
MPGYRTDGPQQPPASGQQPSARRSPEGQPSTRSYTRYRENVSQTGDVRAGTPLPLGVSPRGDGANFAIFSRHATGVWLEFFAQAQDGVPIHVIELIPEIHRTGDVWHIWVKGVQPGQLYGYRIDGPYHPQAGLRYNRHKLLFDPYATAITGIQDWDFSPSLGYNIGSAQADLSFSEADDAGFKPKCVYTHEHFDWQADRPLQRSWEETVIYEAHVRGLTIHPESGVGHPGTYRGLTEKIPYLKELGVTAIELLPVHEFNERELGRLNPQTGEQLKNYWGYNTVAFFAPKASYASSGSLGHQKVEFKEMVRACHRSGLEVILDVVFNHTAEGDQRGPTLSFRGIDNPVYYALADDRRYYRDYSGTGNSLNANHPVIRDFVLDALRYWVLEMHVDGFRFDLASVMDRDQNGNLLAAAPLLERIAEDPILRQTKLIAEAWDAAGAYQVGGFSETRWAEWNGRFRDDVRRFWRGDEGMLGLFATRLCGSADLYQGSGKGPESSINFVTCHDGFTLNDLVSFAGKHNQSNGQDNADGQDENFSANYGVEGPSDDPTIEDVRLRQIKNLLLTLFLARGVPMLLGGDEFRRTQQGNNNAYCQDNELSWLDWSLLSHQREIFRFTQGMIALRRALPVVRREAFYTSSEIRFFDPQGEPPAWQSPSEKRLGIRIQESGGPAVCLLFNAGTEPAVFTLPELPQTAPWRLAVDTLQPAPGDLFAFGQEASLDDELSYRVGGRSAVILIAHVSAAIKKKID